MDTAYGIQWYYGILRRNTTTLQPPLVPILFLVALCLPTKWSNACTTASGFPTGFASSNRCFATPSTRVVSGDRTGFLERGFANCCENRSRVGMESFHETGGCVYLFVSASAARVKNGKEYKRKGILYEAYTDAYEIITIHL